MKSTVQFKEAIYMCVKYLYIYIYKTYIYVNVKITPRTHIYIYESFWRLNYHLETLAKQCVGKKQSVGKPRKKSTISWESEYCFI